MSLFGNEHISLHLYWVSWVLRNNGFGIKMVDTINYLRECVEVYQKHSDSNKFIQKYEKALSIISVRKVGF